MNPLNPNPFGEVADLFRDPAPPGADPYRGLFRAKLTAKTSVAGVWNYDWTEQTFDRATGQHSDANPGRSGSYSGGSPYSPAIELNNTSIDVTSPVYVWMRQKGIVNGQTYYEFQYTPPSSGTSLSSSFSTGSSVVSTAADDTWTTGPSGINLPGAGTYIVYAMVSVWGVLTAGAPGYVYCRLWDSTNAAALTDQYTAVTAQVASVVNENVCTIVARVVATGAVAVRPQVKRASGTATWFGAGISHSGVTTPCTFGYLQIA